MNSILARIAVVTLLCGSASAQTSPAKATHDTDVPPSHSPTDVYEAVLRYQIKSWELAAKFYCVRVDGKDADPALLARFKPLLVQGASACKKKTQGLFTGVVDRKTGKNAVIFDMEQIRWIGSSEAEVNGGYYCASECMAGGTYHVIWDGNDWVVKTFDIRVQS